MVFPQLRPSPRQMEVLRAVYRLGSHKDAAAALGVTAGTMKYHLAELYRRMGVENAYEAAYALWLREQWGEGVWGPRGADL